MNVSDNLKSVFSGCEHPRIITNKYTGRTVKVDCGHCNACLLQKASKRTMLCNIQQEQSKYAYFITLTYDAHSVPKASLSRNSEGLCTITSIPRDTIFNDEIFTETLDYEISDKFISQYKDKCNLDALGKYPQYKGLIPYLNYPDLQKFNKRLRKNLFTKLGNYEKIHTFAVGEYGPVHFRPHFHILLFTNSQEIASVLPECVSKSWSFGRIDCDPVEQGASSYVSGYLNSYTKLPIFYKVIRRFRPFSRFSNYFAQELFSKEFQNLPKENLANVDTYVNGICYIINGKPVTIHPWRSLVSRLFPRFSDDVRRSSYENYAIIKDVLRLRYRDYPRDGFIDDSSIYNLAKYAFLKICSYTSNSFRISDMPDNLYNIYIRSRLSEYFPLKSQEAVSCIYRFFRKVFDFIDMYTSVPFSDIRFYKQCITGLKFIDHYYQQSSYKCLTQQLLNYEEFVTNPITSAHPEGALFLYCLTPPNNMSLDDMLSSNPLYSYYVKKNSYDIENAVKHKKLNDANGIFIYNQN